MQTVSVTLPPLENRLGNGIPARAHYVHGRAVLQDNLDPPCAVVAMEFDTGAASWARMQVPFEPVRLVGTFKTWEEATAWCNAAPRPAQPSVSAEQWGMAPVGEPR